MTLADKRKVIEMLLAIGDPENHATSASNSAVHFDEPAEFGHAAYDLWSRVEADCKDDWSKEGISGAYTEAAYRLIESSPTLRREWFGAP